MVSILFLLQLELGQEELETLIGKTKAELSNLNDEEKEDESDEEEEKEDDSDESEKMEGDAESEDDAVEADEDAKIAKEYGLDKYDDGLLNRMQFSPCFSHWL